MKIMNKCSQKYASNKLRKCIYICFYIGILTLVFVTSFKSDNDSSKLFLEKLKGPISATNQDLIAFIRKRFLHVPSDQKYNLRKLKMDLDSILYSSTQWKSTFEIKEIITSLYPTKTGKQNGFFIEAGAMDGEWGSNTLYLELELNWTGLLIEPDSQEFAKLLTKNRRTWACHCCLSTKPYPFQTLLLKRSKNREYKDQFYASAMNALVDSDSINYRIGAFQDVHSENVQCLPLESILKAINVTFVDLFSLDIEDSEIEVLDYFPWDTVTVDVWVIEHRNRKHSEYEDDVVDQEFIKWFKRKNYQLYNVSEGSPKDYTFIRNNSTIARQAEYLNKNKSKQDQQILINRT